ncbi:MAG: hypothetical protein E7233_01130 [Lachnospiraceae bacterium]|nr:hypothetical protein [Lachnospiraceae bacterium]
MESMPKKEMTTISVRDMIIYILSKWKILIVCLVLGAVVLGAYSGYKSLKNTGEIALEKRGEKLEKTLSEGEKGKAMNTAVTIAHYLNQYGNYAEYSARSEFQKLDPSSVKVRTLTYYLDSKESGTMKESDVAGFANAYRFNLVDELFEQEVAEAFGIPVEEAFYYYDKTVRVRIDEERPIDESVFVVNIYHTDDEFLDKMSEIVKSRIERYSAEVSKAAPDQSVRFISEITSKSNGSYVYDTQEKNVSTCKTLVSDLEKITNALSGDELVYTKYLLTQVYDGEYTSIAFANMGEEEAKAPKLHISKKYVLIGAVGGLFAAALIVLLVYLLSHRLRGYNDMEYIYGIPVLGTFDDPKTVKKNSFILDKWLRSLRLRRKSQDYEGSVKLIAVKLKLAAKNNGIGNICIAVGPSVSTDVKFLEDIKQNTEEIKVSVAEDILRNADAIDKLFDVDGVVLMEQMDKSRLSEISEECRLLAGNNIRIIGAVVAE